MRAPVLVVSFSDEGFVAKSEIEAILRARGEVRVIEREYNRYVGAQIGIYNPREEKVGRVGRLRNREFLFVVAPPGVEISFPRAEGGAARSCDASCLGPAGS